eukprot:COSAG01_NODE_72314_length_253_cov_0.792208_1_plen_22_part_01
MGVYGAIQAIDGQLHVGHVRAA